MKRLFLFATIVAAMLASCAPAKDAPGELVIIHTNDTHSTIDPDSSNDMGGAARRKVLIDSIRAEHPEALLIDAGDIVQGTLYFYLYKGKVEQMVLNELDYDIQILGNHEFDNGMTAMRAMLAEAGPQLLASNYQFADSLLNARFAPYIIKEIGGKRVGLFALNLNPKGMVAEGNYNGVTYIPWQEVAQKTIDRLRGPEKADYVIAVTHIGVESSEENPELFGDRKLAEQTHGIDLIVGGHSHTMLNPALRVANSRGDSVLIVQTGKNGRYLGEAKINLNSGRVTDRLIPVDSRLDSRRDNAFMALLEPYRAGIDSLYSREVGFLAGNEEINSKTAALQNLAADFVRERGEQLAGPLDGAITNKGGLRISWKPGALTEGGIIDMMPFQNSIVVLELKGSDLIDAFKVMEARGGDAVSRITSISQIDPTRTYRIATIDYLANGGDYMTPLTRGKLIASSPNVAYVDMINYVKAHGTITPDTTQRFNK